MKIVFFGTPEFAIPSLSAIQKSKHELIAVVTVPDSEKGRGLKVQYSPVKKFAFENNIEVIQPELLRDESLVNKLNSLLPDLFVVVAFKILPKEIFELPKYGSFNLHASLLPKYRGAAPIQWALMNGEKETGVTTFKLAEKVDTGNIYLKKKIIISDNDNFGTLHDKLADLGAEAVLETINKIESGDVELIPQNNDETTPAPKILKHHCEIDWNKSAIKIHNQIRALSPYPGAFCKFDNKILKIFSSEVDSKSMLKIGEIKRSKSELIVGCGEGALKLLRLQLEGRKVLNVDEFLRGINFSINTID